VSDLTEFLLARIADDEALVHTAIEQHWAWRTMSGIVVADRRSFPERALAECEAKRRIVQQSAWTGPKETLRDRLFGPAADEAYQQGLKAAMRLLAVPYADHPDYDEAWRP